MFSAGSMSNYPLRNIPQVWYVRRREHLETYYSALMELQTKLTKFAGGKNIVAVLEAAESLEQLVQQISQMDEMLAKNISPLSDEYNPYNRNELRRIKDLASSTSVQLETIAKQISWGMPAERQLSQVNRNLYPLIQLVEKILNWLERAAQ